MSIFVHFIVLPLLCFSLSLFLPLFTCSFLFYQFFVRHRRRDVLCSVLFSYFFICIDVFVRHQYSSLVFSRTRQIIWVPDYIFVCFLSILNLRGSYPGHLHFPDLLEWNFVCPPFFSPSATFLLLLNVMLAARESKHNKTILDQQNQFGEPIRLKLTLINRCVHFVDVVCKKNALKFHHFIGTKPIFFIRKPIKTPMSEKAV